MQASWRLEYVATASCINRPIFYFAQAGLGIFTDVATVLAPVPLLRTLQLPTTQKIAVAVMLTMGALCVLRRLLCLETRVDCRADVVLAIVFALLAVFE